MRAPQYSIPYAFILMNATICAFFFSIDPQIWGRGTMDLCVRVCVGKGEGIQ